MPLPRAELPTPPSAGDSWDEPSAGQASAAAIQLVFLDSEPLASSLPVSQRIRIEPLTELSDAVAQIGARRPDLVLIHHRALLQHQALRSPQSASTERLATADSSPESADSARGAMQRALASLRRHDRQLPVIVVTPADQRASEVVFEAIGAGATDVVSEAMSEKGVRAKIVDAVERRRLQKRPTVRRHDTAWRSAGRGQASGPLIMGTCDATAEVLGQLARAARGHFSLLIHGEPGTGKSLAALTVQRHGDRAGEALSVIDCGQSPPDYVDFFLFRELDQSTELRDEHRGKTLIIENVDYAAAQTQRRLLAAIQRQADLSADASDDFPRMIMTCSTAIDPARVGPLLAASAEAGATGLIDELHYELSGDAIHLPPLRRRGNDLAVLIDHFVRSLTGTEPVDEAEGDHRITPQVKAALLAYDWPGNLTQLRSVLRAELDRGEGAIVLSERLAKSLLVHSSASQPEDANAGPPATARFPAAQHAVQPAAAEAGAPSPLRLAELSSPQAWSSTVERCLDGTTPLDDNASLYGDAIQAVEAGLITAVLEKTDGNLAQSARLLGITRVSLRRKIHSLGLQIPGRDPAG